MHTGHRVRTIVDIKDNDGPSSIPAGAVGTVRGKSPGPKDEGYMTVDFDDYFAMAVSQYEIEIMA